MPDMTAKDMSQIAASTSAITNSVMIWSENGWVPDDIVPEIIAKMLNELGVEVNKDELSEAVDGKEENTRLTNPREWFSVHAPMSENDS